MQTLDKLTGERGGMALFAEDAGVPALRVIRPLQCTPPLLESARVVWLRLHRVAEYMAQLLRVDAIVAIRRDAGVRASIPAVAFSSPSSSSDSDSDCDCE